MTPEQIESTMEFILTHQANAEVQVEEIRSIQKESAVQIRALRDEMSTSSKEWDKRHEQLASEIRELSSEIRSLKDATGELKKATGDLLDSDRNNRKRIDRLEDSER